MKSVIIYTYFFSESSNYNLRFFVKNEIMYRENIDYILVINGFYCDENIHIPVLSNLTIIRRENVGYDFGGHKSALDHIQSNDLSYDYYFFANSGVIGPILPHYCTQERNHWSEFFIRKINNIVKLVGTTIVCLPPSDQGEFGPKVEGFFFMVDSIGLALLKMDGTIFYNHATKDDAVLKGEYGLSRCIFKHGYSIDCMIRKYQNIDWRDPINHHQNCNLHPSRNKSFYGASLNPYELIFHKWHWHNLESVNFDIIQQYVDNIT